MHRGVPQTHSNCSNEEDIDAAADHVQAKSIPTTAGVARRHQSLWCAVSTTTTTTTTKTCTGHGLDLYDYAGGHGHAAHHHTPHP